MSFIAMQILNVMQDGSSDVNGTSSLHTILQARNDLSRPQKPMSTACRLKSIDVSGIDLHLFDSAYQVATHQLQSRHDMYQTIHETLGTARIWITHSATHA